MEDGRLGGSAADFPPYPAWQVLLFYGYAELFEPPGLFGQTFIVFYNLKHRILRGAVAHPFSGLTGSIGLLKPMFGTLDRHA